MPGVHLENGGHIGFFKVAPRLNLKVRSQGIITPKMALISTMVTIVTLSHQTTMCFSSKVMTKNMFLYNGVKHKSYSASI